MELFFKRGEFGVLQGTQKGRGGVRRRNRRSKRERQQANGHSLVPYRVKWEL